MKDLNDKKNAPILYSRACSNVSGDRRYYIGTTASNNSAISETFGVACGALVPTGLLVANTCADIGYIVPGVAGIAAFGALHMGFSSVTGYHDRYTDLSFELELNRHIERNFELDDESESYLSQRVKDVRQQRRGVSLKHLAGMTILSAVLAFASSSNMARDGAKQLRDFFMDADKVGEIQSLDDDATPRPVLTSVALANDQGPAEPAM